MPRFHVKEAFELPARNLFVVAGSILEGEDQGFLSGFNMKDESIEVSAEASD